MKQFPANGDFPPFNETVLGVWKTDPHSRTGIPIDQDTAGAPLKYREVIYCNEDPEDLCWVCPHSEYVFWAPDYWVPLPTDEPEKP